MKSIAEAEVTIHKLCKYIHNLNYTTGKHYSVLVVHSIMGRYAYIYKCKLNVNVILIIQQCY